MNCTDAAFDIANGYSWFKDNLPIYDNVNGDATGKYTSSYSTDYFTLVITNTARNDAGVYKCSYNFNEKSDTLAIQGK